MTEWYNHPDARNIDDVKQAQSVIAGKTKTKMSKPADGDEGNQSHPGFQIIDLFDN
jgi:hypothetical protein